MKSLRMFGPLALAGWLVLCCGVPARAGEAFTIAAGAGYRQLVAALGEAYVKSGQAAPQQVYGNMGQVTAQARESGVVDLVIGDKRFLDATDLEFAAEYPIGQGRPVLAVAKGCKAAAWKGLKTLDAAAGKALLADPAVTRIALPDPKKAIYGRAATEFLDRSGLAPAVESKLLTVGTVPQVSAYVASGEVDLGFINLTDGLAISDKVAALIPLDEALFDPIRIVAKALKTCPNPKAAAGFGAFLATPPARAIVAGQGL